MLAPCSGKGVSVSQLLLFETKNHTQQLSG